MINGVVNDLVGEGPINDLDPALAALADPTRRRVVELLGGGPRRAGDLAARCGASRQAMSRHLNVLRSGGLVDVSLDDGDGRGRVYSLRPAGLEALRAWLDQVEAMWSEQLASFASRAGRVAAAAPAGGAVAT
jgi:DNA-binding transcriptional ArsR family regulator